MSFLRKPDPVSIALCEALALDPERVRSLRVDWDTRKVEVEERRGGQVRVYEIPLPGSWAKDLWADVDTP